MAIFAGEFIREPLSCNAANENGQSNHNCYSLLPAEFFRRVQLPCCCAVTAADHRSGPRVNPAKQFQFERLAEEFRAWRAVPEDSRAAAAAWWWSTALALRNESGLLSGDLLQLFGLPAGSTYADAAECLIDAIAAQKSLASPGRFPLKVNPPSQSSSEAHESALPRSDNEIAGSDLDQP